SASRSHYTLSQTNHRNGCRKLVLIVGWIDCTGPLCSATKVCQSATKDASKKDERKENLFLYTRNAMRSQIAKGFIDARYGIPRDTCGI
ncbi:MAG: hypothetical protein ACXW0U_06815, partial [Halobacteriota archaeon]